LFQRKLNVACISPDHVFLRVAHLPASSFEETVSMVEFQLEKLSPLAVAQTVWSLQVVPHSKGNLQTVIVLILARSIVEEFLGRLEGQDTWQTGSNCLYWINCWRLNGEATEPGCTPSAAPAGRLSWLGGTAIPSKTWISSLSPKPTPTAASQNN
jgi:hypothetical protein